MASGACWICKADSETGEHRVKKSDLVHRFGKGPYTGNEALIHVKADETKPLQGPNSQLVKHAKNLCADCNNTFTQPFDKAYEEFIEWVMSHEPEVLSRRVIDFEAVYGDEWEWKQRNLFKYFAKCFGNRIDESNRSVPLDVVSLLSDTVFETALHVTMMVNEDQLLLPKLAQGIGTAELYAHQDPHSLNDLAYQCGHFYRWLCFMYWYNYVPPDPVGARWVADSKHVYLGWYAPLAPEQRQQLVESLAAE